MTISNATEPFAEPGAQPWTIERSRALYNIEGWGNGYFDINAKGHIVVRPDQDERGRELDLFEMAMDLEAQGVGMPLLLRFSDILRSRIEALHERFTSAMKEFKYEGAYTTIYPIKVNQQRHVVEEIVEFGQPFNVGLECGSKPELQAVLGLAETTGHVIICNGYKDEEFMRLALMGQKLGHQVFIVVEQVSEVDVLLQAAAELDVKPNIGVRIKLFAEGAGRWAGSGGEKSKFGLSTAQLIRVIDKLAATDQLDAIRLLHFHLGSQITDIRYIKAGLQEIARYYSELRKMGLNVTHVDVGGGLGVDYDGTGSTSHASVNYSLQEYANDVVYTLAEACRLEQLPMPHIISESGRALTAYHALLLLSVIDVESLTEVVPPELTDDDPPLLHEMATDLQSVNARRVREVFHDAMFDKDRAQQLFASGVLSLRERARAEQLHLAIINAVAREARKDREEYSDIMEDVEATLVDRYFCNFSLFQSLPDSWAIDQLFPIMPVHRLSLKDAATGRVTDHAEFAKLQQLVHVALKGAKYEITYAEVINSDKHRQMFDGEAKNLEHRLRESPDLFAKQTWRSPAGGDISELEAVHDAFLNEAELLPHNRATGRLIRVLPVVHGIKSEDHAHKLAAGGLAKAGKTDNGYFGSGIYSSTYIDYVVRDPAEYSKPHPKTGDKWLLVCWALTGNVLPKVQHTKGAPFPAGYDTIMRVQRSTQSCCRRQSTMKGLTKSSSISKRA